MIRCRVKQVGLKFYPQYKKFIFWKKCPENTWTCINHKDDLSENTEVIYILQKQYFGYSSLKGAEACLAKFIKEIYPADVYKNHKIKIAYTVSTSDYHYPPESRTYYYSESYKIHINESDAYPICGETIKKVMDKIDVFESKMALTKIRKIYTYDE